MILYLYSLTSMMYCPISGGNVIIILRSRLYLQMWLRSEETCSSLILLVCRNRQRTYIRTGLIWSNSISSDAVKCLGVIYSKRSSIFSFFFYSYFQQSFFFHCFLLVSGSSKNYYYWSLNIQKLYSNFGYNYYCRHELCFFLKAINY